MALLLEQQWQVSQPMDALIVRAEPCYPSGAEEEEYASSITITGGGSSRRYDYKTLQATQLVDLSAPPMEWEDSDLENTQLEEDEEQENIESPGVDQLEEELDDPSTTHCTTTDLYGTFLSDHQGNPNVSSFVMAEEEAVPVFGSSSDDPMMDSSHGNAPLLNRAEFISARITKPNKHTKFGFTFRLSRRNRTFTIVAIKSNGLLAQTPLQAGDVIVSVNQKCVDGFSTHGLSKYLHSLVGPVTFVVHNVGGDSTLVESFVTKPRPQCKTGVRLLNSSRRTAAWDRPLLVAHIYQEGLYATSLLKTDDIIVAINGDTLAEQWNATTAANAIGAAPHSVSIVAKTAPETASVLASEDVDHSHLLQSGAVAKKSKSRRRASIHVMDLLRAAMLGTTSSPVLAL